MTAPDGAYCYPFSCEEGAKIRKELALKKIYVFAKPLNGIGSLDMMIGFALTGRILGLEEVLQMPQVLQNATFHQISDVMKDTNSLERALEMTQNSLLGK